MLCTNANEFNWSVNNYGSTYTNTGFGTQITAHASAHTKGDTVELIATAALTEDCYGISISFVGGNAAGTAKNFLVDIMVDEAGGTSWSVKIPDLLVGSPAITQRNYRYYFPIFIKAGSSVGARMQANVGALTLRCGIKLLGKPSRIELLKYGHTVETYGVQPATNSSGTAITPGTSAMGAYTASIGTTSRDYWFWQMGWATADGSITAGQYAFDIAVGDATNKRLCIENIGCTIDGVEASGKDAFGDGSNILLVPSGSSIYGRAACVTTPDAGITFSVYGVN